MDAHSPSRINTQLDDLFELSCHADAKYLNRRIRKSHGYRVINAPDDELKKVQRQLLDDYLYQLPATKYAHGFVPGRSIVTNAWPHTGQDWVVTCDLKDFFPSISHRRVRRAICSLPLSERDILTIVRLVTRKLCLPQGAPTSPHIANLVAVGLDIKMAQLADADGWTYTRYADDMTFSGSGNTRTLLARVKTVVRSEKFVLAPRKTKIMSKYDRQKVTGLVVNEKVNLPKEQRRKLRAMLHNWKLNSGGWVTNPLHDETELNILNGHLSLARLIDHNAFRGSIFDLMTITGVE